jgi:hypothetical protein
MTGRKNAGQKSSIAAKNLSMSSEIEAAPTELPPMISKCLCSTGIVAESAHCVEEDAPRTGSFDSRR